MTDDREALFERLHDPGFTPGARDVPKLLELWRGKVEGAPKGERSKITKLFVRVLGRADHAAAIRLLRDLWVADPPERAVRLRALARIFDRLELPEWEETLARAVADPDARVVREALRAAGRLDRADRLESGVIEQLSRAALPEQRAAADALGRIGGVAGLGALRELATGDEELARRCAEAIALIERRELRSERTSILAQAAIPQATPVLLRCRAGTERFAREQACAVLDLSERDVRLDPQGVTLSWSGTLEQLHGVRIAVEVALLFELAPGKELAGRITETLASQPVGASLRAWSVGPLRFRLSFLDGKSRRAVVRAVASSLSEQGAPLQNDSRDAPWRVEVDIERSRLLCLPRDPGQRFGYRRAQIPAASHPTLAALMAWVAAPRPGEVVWDPFCGSGSELIECALLEPTVRLFGTDQSAEALTAAATNLEAAGIAVEPGGLVQADALESEPGGASAAVTPSLIVTNPPMGRRVGSGYGVHEFLRRFVAHAADLLSPDGRLVWVTPAPKVSAAAGRDAGLKVTDHGTVELAGFRVHLQVVAR